MLKLMKYDARRHYKPFTVIIFINLLTMLTGLLGFNNQVLYMILRDSFGLVQLILIIYTCKEIHKDFCSDYNILAQQLPVDSIVRLLSKVIVFSMLYVIYQCSRLIAEISCNSSVYNTLKTYTLNYKDYMTYDFIGLLLFYLSTVSIVSFGLILGNSIFKNKNITSVANIFIVFFLFWSSTMIFQRHWGYNANIFYAFEYRTDAPQKGIDIELRTHYIPFGYARTSSDLNPEHSTYIQEKVGLKALMTKSTLYCTAWILVSFVAAIVLIKWRGVNQ